MPRAQDAYYSLKRSKWSQFFRPQSQEKTNLTNPEPKKIDCKTTACLALFLSSSGAGIVIGLITYPKATAISVTFFTFLCVSAFCIKKAMGKECDDTQTEEENNETSLLIR